MSLTRPLPRKAEPVAETLRRDVPRPDPRAATFTVGWKRDGRDCCAMGLHPKANSGFPSVHWHLPITGVTTLAMLTFGNWWDEQTDAEAAVEAVWGPA